MTSAVVDSSQLYNFSESSIVWGRHSEAQRGIFYGLIVD